MDSEIMVEALPLLGVCNLCLNEGAVRSMLVSLSHGLNYSEMLQKCFCIDLTLSDLVDVKRLICDGCAARLTDCFSFREQVDTALRTLETSLRICKLKDEVKPEPVNVSGDFDDHFNTAMDDDDDDDDNIVLKEIAIKKEPEEQMKKHRTKIKIKLPKLPKQRSSKALRLAETDAMLESGLFPFKIQKDRSFTCGVCSETSTNLEDIQTHVKGHSKMNIYLAFKKMMFSSSQRFYKNSKCLRCKICTTDLNNFEELKSHLENCIRLKHNSYKWNKLPFKLEKDQLDCPVCSKRFLNFVSLNTHMNLHYPNFICESCGKAFASKARLRGHMRTHEVGSFPCRYCEAVFDRVTKRENHVSKEHKAGVRYACKRCNISLTSFYARQKHLAEVHNEELKRYKCKVCPQSYITPGHLSSHVRRDHLNERNHKCDKCDLAFYTKNALKMHMIKHDGERIHSCNVCQKSYQRKKTLREHMRIHDNDKRFVCPVCARAFTQKCTLKGHLKVHERKVELDDRIMQPISCRIVQ